MSYTERYTNRRFFAAGAALLLLGIVLLLLCACSRPETEITSACPKAAAEALALHNATLLHGKVLEIESESNSMGYGISQHAFVVVVDDWNNVEVGQVIVFVDDAGDCVIHQVIEKNQVSVRTRGANNPNGQTEYVTRKAYIGTMIVQIYHQEVEQ